MGQRLVLFAEQHDGVALAQVLLGGLMEGALLLAASPTPEISRQEVGRAVALLIDGLAAPARPARPRR